jgi:polysaccharide export outer membrane protein
MRLFNKHITFWILFLFCCEFFSATSVFAEDVRTTSGKSDYAYHLGSGDKLKIEVFNQDDLKGEYTVDGTGNVSLPLIGTLAAKNLTLSEFEQKMKEKLSPDYLKDPKISVQVLNYRPFYILGEVKKPDSYPYVSGMTYGKAVATAGGFTYRAKESFVYVKHDDTPDQKEIETKLDEYVMPGDIIRVDERLF